MSSAEFVSTEPESNIGLKTIKIRLAAVKESVNRARFAFLVSTIASLAIITAAWNAYGSWYRGFALRELPYAAQATDVVDEAQKQIISEWIKNQTIAIGPLGIRIGISDAAVVGAFGLCVIAIWFYFSMRRANRVIGFLLIETKNKSPEIQMMIFFSIATSLIFSDIGGGDQSIDNLESPPPKDNDPIVRKAVRILFYLPALTIFAVVILDILSIWFLSSTFRAGHHPLWSILKNADIKTWIQIIVWEALAIGLGILTCRFCYKIDKFERDIGTIVRDYRNRPGLNEVISKSRS